MDVISVEIVVIGGGPGGYAAAFMAADHGKQVLIVDRESKLGGTCLNWGCIPSKALIHVVDTVCDAKNLSAKGISFGEPKFDLELLNRWKDGVVSKLASGIAFLAQKRGVKVLEGNAKFQDAHTLLVETAEGTRQVEFKCAIIATGSSPTLPGVFRINDPGIMTSREALELKSVPPNLLVVGGGYIGMELGSVYAALGSQVVLVEAQETVLAGVDQDLVRPVVVKARKLFREIRINSRVATVLRNGDHFMVGIEHQGGVSEGAFDGILVSVGRSANCDNLNLNCTKVQRDSKGFISVDSNQRTSESSIFAIGDVCGGVMLAHKASMEAKIAVETIVGDSVGRRSAVIPAVVFTNPEIAWCGLTESEAKIKGIPVNVSKFPWAASGRALTLDRLDGLTKLILEPGTDRILGAGIVGHGAGELIGEATLAVEMQATANDLEMTVHAHPTLSETLMEAAGAFYGHATHVLGRKVPAK